MAKLSNEDFVKRLKHMCMFLDIALWTEVKRGGHVIIEGENGQFYDYWKKTYYCSARISSHYMIDSMSSLLNNRSFLLQYEIGPLNVDGHTGWFLFGLVPGQQRRTWFQLEAHSGNFLKPVEAIQHMNDYIKSVRDSSQLQYGPGGLTSKCKDLHIGVEYTQFSRDDSLFGDLFNIDYLPYKWRFNLEALYLKPNFPFNLKIE